MGVFLVTFMVMVLAVAGMAVGVMFGRSPIAGSCGGLNAVNGSGTCQSCSRPCQSGRRLQAKFQRDEHSSSRHAESDGQPLRQHKLLSSTQANNSQRGQS